MSPASIPDGSVESTTLFEANSLTKTSAEIAEAVGSDWGGRPFA
jgi:hypothetical protein